MATGSIKDKYLEILTALGDVQAAMDLVLPRYAVEQITARIIIAAAKRVRRRFLTASSMYQIEGETAVFKLLLGHDYYLGLSPTTNFWA